MATNFRLGNPETADNMVLVWPSHQTTGLIIPYHKDQYVIDHDSIVELRTSGKFSQTQSDIEV